MNRRSILGIMAGAPFAAKTVAKDVAGATSYGYMGAQAANAGSGSQKGLLDTPLVQRDNALKMIFSNPASFAEICDELFAEQRTVFTVDPDIAVLKSFSDMAKITFQRQRNVERALAELQDERWDRPQRYVRALSKHLDKIMWGR